MFNNPIQPSNLFITPTSEQQLADIAFSMSNKSEAWRMMMFTMNYCHQLVENECKDAIERKRVRLVSKPSTSIMSEEERAEIREEEHQVLMSYYAPKKNI